MLAGCSGYSSTIERAKISNSIFLNGFYGKTIKETQTPLGSKDFSEVLINFGFEKVIQENFSFNFNLTSQNQFQNFENFSDTLNYLRLNFGFKNKILDNLTFKAELIYDIDLNSEPFRPYNQTYLYGIGKFIYDYKNFSFIFSLNSLSISYNKSLFSIISSIYFRPDYSYPILNVGFGLRR